MDTCISSPFNCAGGMACASITVGPLSCPSNVADIWVGLCSGAASLFIITILGFAYSISSRCNFGMDHAFDLLCVIPSNMGNVLLVAFPIT